MRGEVDDGRAQAGVGRAVSEAAEQASPRPRRARSRRDSGGHRAPKVREAQVPEVVRSGTAVVGRDLAKTVKHWFQKKGVHLINDPTPLAVMLVDVGKLALAQIARDLTDPALGRREKRKIALAIGPRLGVEFRKRAPRETTPGDRPPADDGAGEALLKVYGGTKS